MTKWLTALSLYAVLFLMLTGCDNSGGRPAVRTFMNTWLKSGGNSAVALMDPHTSNIQKEVIQQDWRLKSWDGNISSLGEGNVTDLYTGNQYKVMIYQVETVVEITFYGASVGFSPETLEVAIAKESNKVIMIKPHTLKDK